MVAPTSLQHEGSPVQGHAALCPRGGDVGRHRLRFVRQLRGGGVAGLDCAQPLLVVCDDCGHETHWRCKSTRASRCGSCSETYRRRLVRIAETGLTDSAGFVPYLLTLTGPGTTASHRRWDPSLDSAHPRLSKIRALGAREVCGCEIQRGEAGAWNASAGRRWNHFRTTLARSVEGLEFARFVEVQEKRGVLHLHVLVLSPVALDVVVLQRLALAAGFGCVLDLQRITDPARSARYVSKYVTKAADAREDVPWVRDHVDEDTGEVRAVRTPARYRTWSASRGWPCTMGQIRAVAAAQARARAEALRSLAGVQLDGQALGLVLPGHGGPAPPAAVVPG